MMNWGNTIHTPSGFLCAPWDAYFMLSKATTMSADMEQDESLGKDKELVLLLTQFSLTFLLPVLCIISI